MPTRPTRTRKPTSTSTTRPGGARIAAAASVACLAAMLASGAHAAPFDGLTAATAGLSAKQIKASFAASVDGVYWIDADGAGGAAASQFYADMTTAGGGWLLVRHTAGSGNWINVQDDLKGTASLNPTLKLDPNAVQSWTIPFGLVTEQFLFKTGNGKSWGVLAATDVYTQQNDTGARMATVLASAGTAVAAGGKTNVLQRYISNNGSIEDPWIGFEGTHWDNIPKMLYGEGNFGWAGHVAFKNASGGANVFIRELNAPMVPVPEPGTLPLLAMGAAVVLAAVRRRVRSEG